MQALRELSLCLRARARITFPNCGKSRLMGAWKFGENGGGMGITGNDLSVHGDKSHPDNKSLLGHLSQ